jgi:hypothetical protein
MMFPLLAPFKPVWCGTPGAMAAAGAVKAIDLAVRMRKQ